MVGEPKEVRKREALLPEPAGKAAVGRGDRLFLTGFPTALRCPVTPRRTEFLLPLT